MTTSRSNRIAARFSWWLLPRIGYYAEGFDRVRAWPWYMLWKLVAKLPSSALYEPSEPIICTCDYCRGVPGAVYEP